MAVRKDCCIAAKMNKRLILQRPVAARSLTGQSSNTWEDVATVWASIEPLSGRELWQAQQQNPLCTTRITIRYRTDVRGDWRSSYQGKIFSMVGLPIDPDMEHVFLILQSNEGDGAKQS